MKKMNKTLRFLCSALVLILLASALFSCTKTPETTNTETDTGTETDEGLSVPTLNGVPLTEYSIVHTRKTNSGGEKAADYLNQKLTELYGITLAKEIKSQADRYEILIGMAGGDDAIEEAYESSKGTMIGTAGKRVALMGKNYATLCTSIDTFLGKAVANGENVSISVTEFEYPEFTTFDLNVMSYNILFDMEKEGRDADCLAQMCEIIMENDVDVLGTQEDGEVHSAYFLENMKVYSVFKGDRDEGNHVYWKTDKFNLIKKGYYYLSNTPTVKSKFEGSNHYRTMTFVILEEKVTGKQFLFINTHADYQSTESVRKDQLSVLTSLIKSVNKDSLPVVLLGDFNTTTTRSNSALLDFMGNNPEIALTNKVAAEKGDTGATLVDGIVKRGTEVFDYILINTERVVTKYFTVVNTLKNGKYPSDHLPVFAKVEIY